jgi:hypothetical protein
MDDVKRIFRETERFLCGLSIASKKATLLLPDTSYISVAFSFSWNKKAPRIPYFLMRFSAAFTSQKSAGKSWL